MEKPVQDMILNKSINSAYCIANNKEKQKVLKIYVELQVK